MLSAVLCALLMQTGYRSAYPLPDLTVPSGLGVNVHIIEPKDASIAKLAGAGIKWIRMDLLWNEVEHHKGEYDFTHYDKLNDQLRQYGIRPIYILNYGNEFYQKGAPRSDEARAAFVRFAHAALQHYRMQGVVWEMYNEPNIHFWEPKPNVGEYVALATDVGKEIRANEPEEWFIGPAVSGMDWNFLEGCMKGGLLNYWDAVSVHPYRTDPPDTVFADWQRLRHLVKTYNQSARPISLICSEWGYSSLPFGEQGQADYLARMVLTNMAASVPLTIWYDWKDDVENKRADERHFGLVSPDLNAKQSLSAASTLVKELGGWKLATRDIQDGRTVLIFRKGGRSKAVAWATEGDHATAHLSLPIGDYSIHSEGGETHVVHVGPDGADIEVTATPSYISPVLTK